MIDKILLRKLTAFALVLALLALPACSAQETNDAADDVTVRVAALRGPTGIGLVKMMADHENGETANNYDFTISSTPDDIVALISSRQVDIAALPSNMAAILYQRTSQQIQLLAVNTLGVLYILENGDTVHQLDDLRGRELLSTGQGATPEYIINEILVQAGLQDEVTVTYKTEHEELATLAAAGMAELLVLPEPFVTTVLNRNPDMRIALDLTQIWRDVHAGQNQSELAMGCMIVNKDFAEAHPQVIATFLNEYRASVEAVNADPEKAGEWVEQFGIMNNAALAAQAIPNCNIVLIYGQAIRPVLEPFYTVLHAANPQSVGGLLPDADFYYSP